MNRARARLWPASLKGQVLFALALALLFAQTVGAVLQYRVELERHRDGQVHMLAFRFIAAWARAGEPLPPRLRDRAGLIPGDPSPRPRPTGAVPDARPDSPDSRPVDLFRSFRPVAVAGFSPQPDDERIARMEADLARVLGDMGVNVAQVVIVSRPIARDAVASAVLATRGAVLPRDVADTDQVIVAAVRRRRQDSWEVARVLAPPVQPHQLALIVMQTFFLYVVMVVAMALVVRRITRPLAALTSRLEQFGNARDASGQVEPQGPDDLRRLIAAHNAMETRILALLDEKDVMLGAIGHDLKTPLSALRVRIESVDDDAERARMAATIDDIARSLDDMLSLARAGRPSDPREPTELSALVASVVEEFEDMGEPVMLAPMSRVVLSARATWLRRGLRNLIANALRYGKEARVRMERVAGRDGGWVEIAVDDDGPGIPEAEIEHMLEPFVRGEPSRNSTTGGAGLGLTLARTIAWQHGGTLALSNRIGPGGAVAGLTARLRLPIKAGIEFGR